MKFYEINGKRNLCGDRIREARQKRRLSKSDLCKLLQLRGDHGGAGCDQPHGEREQNCDGL